MTRFPLMATHNMMNPFGFVLEFAYSFLVLVIFIYLFYKTKHIFDLTKHKGIKYFRMSFLFFALSFFTRFMFFLIRLIVHNTNLHIPGRTLSFLSLIFITYFSTIAISYLIYSTLWRKVKHIVFFVFANLLSIVSILMFYFRNSFIFFIFIQLFLIISLIFVNSKKKTQFIYPLISLFWIFNLAIFHTRRVFSNEIKLVFQIFSLFLLIYLTYKIIKWIK